GNKLAARAHEQRGSSLDATLTDRAPAMSWPALFLVLVLSHLVGDFLLQTNWQAIHKIHGLSRIPESRRALLIHGFAYTLAFLPALGWVASEVDFGTAAAGGALV